MATRAIATTHTTTPSPRSINHLHPGNASSARAVLDGLIASPSRYGFFFAAYDREGRVIDDSLDVGNTAYAGIAFAHARRARACSLLRLCPTPRAVPHLC